MVPITILALAAGSVLGIMSLRDDRPVAAPVTVTVTEGVEAPAPTVTVTLDSRGDEPPPSTRTPVTSGATTVVGESSLDAADPGVAFDVAYEAQSVTLNPPGSTGTLALDLDAPAVTTSGDASDVSIVWSSGQIQSFDVKDARVAQVSGPSSTPQDCVRAINATPIGTRLQPTTDLTVCTITNGVGAAGEPLRAKIAFMTFTSIPDPSTMTIEMSAWIARTTSQVSSTTQTG